jgi:drug/metabolite transporter (DMT)-like permease
MSVIWGIPYLMIKVAVEGVSVPVLVFARTAVGAAILLPLALRGGRLTGMRRHWRPLAAFAALEIVIPWWLLSDAERHLTSSMTGLLIAAVPIITVVATRLVGGGTERVGVKRAAGLAIGFAGVAVLAAPELRGGESWSFVEVLLTATCYAVAPLIAARRLAEVPALPMTAVCLAAAALVYAPPAVLTWPDALPAVSVLAALAGLAVVCTALAFIVFFALIREVGPSRALVFTYVNPAVAVVAGVAVLGEPLTVTIMVAFALILCGSVLATLSTAPRSEPVAPVPPATSDRLAGELSQ